MGERSTGDGHLPHLDGVRALLALYVVAHHCYLTVWAPEHGASPPSHLAAHLFNWLLFGRLAVAGFIALSGYCLMLPVARGNGILRGGAPRFFYKRARRILPTFYAALIFCSILGLTILKHRTNTLWDGTLPVDRRAFILNLLMVQNVFAPHAINYVFWSIALEWQIYFLFPLLVYLFRTVGPGWVAIAVVLLSIEGRLAVAYTHISHLAVHYLGIFALGMLAAAISGRLSPTSRSASAIRIAAIAATLLLVALCYHWGGQDTPALRSEMLAGATLAIWLAAWSLPVRSISKSILQWGPLYWIGTFSYSLYLLHAPLIQLDWQFLIHPLHLQGIGGLWVLMLTAIPACLSFAWFFFIFFERPFMSSRQKRAVEEAGQAVKPRSSLEATAPQR